MNNTWDRPASLSICWPAALFPVLLLQTAADKTGVNKHHVPLTGLSFELQCPQYGGRQLPVQIMTSQWSLRSQQVLYSVVVKGLHLYSTFIQSTVQFMPLIHTFTHQRRFAAMQGTNQLVRSNWGLGVLLRDTCLLSHIARVETSLPPVHECLNTEVKSWMTQETLK